MTAVLGLTAALLLNGCSDDSPQETATQAPTAEAPATSEPAATTEPRGDDAETTTAPPELSAEEQDQAGVEETLKLYTTALNDAFNGDASIEAIYPFSRDTAREQWVTEVMAVEARGIDFSGSSELEVLEVSVDGNTATAVACADVSTVQAVNENGDSIIADDRIDKTLKDYVLERDDSALVGWYVVDDTNRNEPCDG